MKNLLRLLALAIFWTWGTAAAQDVHAVPALPKKVSTAPNMSLRERS